ncbi:hypothetical protein ACP70R_016994 [Stipagrostis hirtigluma subsp. patula]
MTARRGELGKARRGAARVPNGPYVSVVLRANDNGEGGTFALYSLTYRHANVSLLPNGRSPTRSSPPTISSSRRRPQWLEKHRNLHTALLVMVMIGSCMVIGDGVLTPCSPLFQGSSYPCPRSA